MVKSLFIRWFIDGVAFWVAIQVVPGIHTTNDIGKLAIAVAIFCMVNAMLRPIFWLLTCPLILVIVGPLILSLNTMILWLSVWLAGHLGLNISLEGGVTALMGALIVSIVRTTITSLVRVMRSMQIFRRKPKRIKQLEKSKEWLEEQRDHWKRLATYRELVIQEQQNMIDSLK